MVDHDDLIVRYFRYLVDEYGYHIEHKEFSPETMGNAYVTFKSSSIGIQIVIDRNQALMVIGDQSQPIAKWFDFTYVLEYFAPSEIAYDFGEKTDANTWEEVIEAQLARLALIVRKYCDPLLSGDLGMKGDIERIQTGRGVETMEHLNKLSQVYRESRARDSN